MSFFTSQRERRLWAWTLTVVVAIYSTLVLASRLTDVMRDHGQIMVFLFVLGCLLVLTAAVTQGLRARPKGLEIAVALGVVAAYLMVFVRMTSAVERSHLIEYGVVAIFIFAALTERIRNGHNVPIPAVLAIIAASLIGVLDESIQLMLPARVFDPLDILFNIFAAIMAVSASIALGWARRRSSLMRRK